LALVACSRNPTPHGLGVKELVGCYVLNAVPKEDLGGFPDTLGLISTPSFVDDPSENTYGIRFTPREALADSTLSLRWNWFGSDSLEILGGTELFSMEFAGHFTDDGFTGRLNVVNDSTKLERGRHIQATREHCLGF